MNEYTIYNPDNGCIVKALRCPPELLEVNLAGNDKYVEGFYDPSAYRLADGKAVSTVTEDNEIERSNLTRRHSGLKATDWTQLADVALTDSQKTKYATYRQAMRDITTHSNWPNLNDSDWPQLEK